MSKSDLTDRRKARVRLAIRKNAGGRPRLSVFRSSKQIYAQIIDDARGVTLAAASTLEKDNRTSLKTGADVAAAKHRGRSSSPAGPSRPASAKWSSTAAPICIHGRVKALAEGAREGGLKF